MHPSSRLRRCRLSACAPTDVADLELKPAEFRTVPRKALASPRTLWICVLAFAAFTALGSWVIADRLGPLVALGIVAPALMLGVCLAGLFPRYFFSRRN